ncbi:acetyltransferase [Vibrio cholerae]|nr:acetyltransferase [Vibrio cholerae]
MCELKKLFLLPTSRGHGVGRALSEHCLNFAKQQGYTKCYLDTLSSMTQAIKLYQQLGFEHLTQPMAGTEHNGCDVWMLKSLN